MLVSTQNTFIQRLLHRRRERPIDFSFQILCFRQVHPAGEAPLWKDRPSVEAESSMNSSRFGLVPRCPSRLMASYSFRVAPLLVWRTSSQFVTIETSFAQAIDDEI
jgi:hypothetical protein